MRRRFRFLSKKRGLPPGSLTYVGDHAEGTPPVMRLLESDEGVFAETAVERISDLEKLIQPDKRYWLRVIGIHDPGLINAIGKRFGLHPLLIEDVLNTEHAPKIEEFGRSVFAIMKLLKEKTDEIQTEHFAIVLKDRFVISFQERESSVFNTVMGRLSRPRSGIEVNEDFVFHSMLDAVVDSYFTVLESIGRRLERLESALYTSTKRSLADEVNQANLQLIDLRRVVRPLRDPLRQMTRPDYKLVDEPLKAYFKDLFDHITFVSDHIESYRDQVNGLYNRLMMAISYRASEVTLTLTVFATIFIPLTFLTGVYGMNFEHMPELDERWAYPAFWIVVVAVTVTMLAYFRKRNWL